MSDSTFLGPFQLHEPIGKGGMGTVYRGVHRMTGVEVAIKVITRASTDHHRQFFQREVQAHAELVHPNIVYLLDYGEVHPVAAESTDHLLAGSPYIAMELAEGGTVEDLLPLDSWDSLRSILVQVLHGLAFAHARDVVHRDLKPENLLVFPDATDPDAEPTIKLTDFGIAYAARAETLDMGNLGTIAGTCFYMPPEQIYAEWRSYGPWTDLYALGCIAFELATGARPFTGASITTIAIAHCEATRPPVQAHFATPDGLENWIHKAIAVDPRDRFRRAADALAGLLALGPASRPGVAPTPRHPRVSLPSEEATAILDTLVTGATRADSSEGPGPSQGRPTSAAGPLPTAPVAIVPETWRRDRISQIPEHLVGTGLQLFNLREIPLAGRDRERDQIWDALRAVGQGHPQKLLVISGPAGVGKSRLARWATHRSHEVGASQVLRAVHAAGKGRGEGLASLVQQAVQGWELDRKGFYNHLLEILPPLGEVDPHRDADARALTELVHPTGTAPLSDDDLAPFRFQSPTQKFALLARFLHRYADRPLLLWLDDLHAGWETLGFVEYLLEDPEIHPPLLIIATVRSDLLADDEVLRRRVDGLSAESDGLVLPLSPLNPTEHREFIDRVLPLERPLAEELARKTEGNPLFVTHLLGDWISSHRLEVGPDGFRLSPGEEIDVPDELHELWLTRLQKVFAADKDRDPQQCLRAMELAAALGREVDLGEWRSLLHRAQCQVDARIIPDLITRGLAIRTGHGWAFSHGLLVDSLSRHAREHRRWARHHHHCAEMLLERYGLTPATAGRRAHHRRLSGDLQEAQAAYLQEIQRLRDLGDIRLLNQSVAARAEVLDDLHLPADHPHRIDNLLHSCFARIKAGQIDPAVDDLLEVLAIAEETDQISFIARACQLLAIAMQRRGELDQAVTYLQTGLKRSSGLDDPTLVGKLALTLGWMFISLGQYQDALPQLRLARTLLEHGGNEPFRLRSIAALGWHALLQGNLDEARKVFQPLLPIVAATEYRGREAECLNALGEIARYSGHHDDAQHYYERYRQLEEEMGNITGRICAHVNLAHNAIDRGAFEDARGPVKETRKLLQRYPIQMYQETLHCAEIALAAGVGDWDTCASLTDRYADGFPEAAAFGKDHPHHLELAGVRALTPRPELAGRLLTLATDLYTRQNAHDDAARARSHLEHLQES